MCALLHHQCAIFNTPTCPSKLHVCPFHEFKCPAKYEDALFSLRLSFPTPCAFLTSIRVYPFQSTCALLNTPICPSELLSSTCAFSSNLNALFSHR